MRIVYGVGGEGMGHATRSSVIIEHLAKKHEIIILTSNRAYDYILKKFGNKIPVYEIQGLMLIYKNNQVKKLNSIMKNIKHILNSKAGKIKNRIEKFNPDIIISDYEPFSAHIGNLMKIPVLSVSNQHISSNTKVKIPRKFYYSYFVLKLLNRTIIPKAYKYIITTFFYTKIKNKKNILVPGVIRDMFIKIKNSNIRTRKKQILVYQTSQSNKAMFRVLKIFKDYTFYIYGFNKNKKDGNLIFKKFNDTEFIETLASSEAVITNGGFTLISEALFLKKPVMSIPVEGHFEQICNALYIHNLGYGEFYEKITKENLCYFLFNLNYYNKHLKKYKQKDNSYLFKKLDEVLEEIKK